MNQNVIARIKMVVYERFSIFWFDLQEFANRNKVNQTNESNIL